MCYLNAEYKLDDPGEGGPYEGDQLDQGDPVALLLPAPAALLLLLGHGQLDAVAQLQQLLLLPPQLRQAVALLALVVPARVE